MGRMNVRLNGDQLEEVECFKYLGPQVAADGGCESNVVHRMNEGFKAWGAMKSVLCNRGLGIKTKKKSIWRSDCIIGVIRSRSVGHKKC